jgi:hypothetical protein
MNNKRKMKKKKTKKTKACTTTSGLLIEMGPHFLFALAGSEGLF